MKKIAAGCDPNASELKKVIKKHLVELGNEWEGYGYKYRTKTETPKEAV